ncbi:hypothetical protein ACIO93_04530 [Streptomyces sp. NPDC087903]|uniref:hypothetical protein n=1 Tax=Streptomyces sp. NPDC087903 TaxID=3365819 RepID=UPI00381D436D
MRLRTSSCDGPGFGRVRSGRGFRWALAVLRVLRRRPHGGERLFALWDPGAWHDLHGGDLNEAPCRQSGTEITAKDFRTWHATVLAAVALAVTTEEARATAAARRAGACARSATTCNTPAVCRASCIAPRVFELFEQGQTIAPVLTRLGEHGHFGRPATQGAVEAAVLDLLGG